MSKSENIDSQCPMDVTINISSGKLIRLFLKTEKILSPHKYSRDRIYFSLKYTNLQYISFVYNK